jgi:hypothetical protein
VLKAFALGALCWLGSPAVAAAESWILWESVKEGRLHPVDSPFPSQAACGARAGTRIEQAWKQYKSQHPDARNNLSDGGLTMSVRQIIRQGSSPELQAKAKEDIAKYRATLEPVLAMFERELARQTELANERQKLFERGALSESELRAGQRALAAAQKDVDNTRRDIKAADQMKAEGDSPPTPTPRWIEFTALRYQCWPVGVNPQ